MASAFAHIAIPTVIYIVFKSKTVNYRVCLLAAMLSILPDVDVVTFRYGIPYESPWGHRGFTHSLLFAASLAGLCSFFTSILRSSRVTVFLFCFISCASHAFLDAMTNGGLGVAIAWPFNQHRYFLPFRPIEVSPVSITAFFSEWGLRVIYSELLWVFMPAASVSLAALAVRHKKSSSKDDY
ncbi:MAG: metal-dependent hydrolase [Methylotenera sp.]